MCSVYMSCKELIICMNTYTLVLHTIITVLSFYMHSIYIYVFYIYSIGRNRKYIDLSR